MPRKKRFQTPDKDGFSSGDIVMARWQDCQEYEAQIVQVHPQHYTVKFFEDGVLYKVKKELVRGKVMSAPALTPVGSQTPLDILQVGMKELIQVIPAANSENIPNTIKSNFQSTDDIVLHKNGSTEDDINTKRAPCTNYEESGSKQNEEVQVMSTPAITTASDQSQSDLIQDIPTTSAFMAAVNPENKSNFQSTEDIVLHKNGSTEDDINTKSAPCTNFEESGSKQNEEVQVMPTPAITTASDQSQSDLIQDIPTTSAFMAAVNPENNPSITKSNSKGSGDNVVLQGKNSKQNNGGTKSFSCTNYGESGNQYNANIQVMPSPAIAPVSGQTPPHLIQNTPTLTSSENSSNITKPYLERQENTRTQNDSTTKHTSHNSHEKSESYTYSEGTTNDESDVKTLSDSSSTNSDESGSEYSVASEDLESAYSDEEFDDVDSVHSSEIELGKENRISATSFSMDASNTDKYSNGNASAALSNTNANTVSINIAATSNEKGKRKWDKLYYCLYCKLPQSKLPRHLKARHATEKEVIALESMDKKNTLKQLCKLRNLGNHIHNCEVLKSGVGTLIVVHRPSSGIKCNNYDHYVPCPVCFGYYAKKELWKHQCLLTDLDNKQRKRGLTNSRLLLPVPNHVSEKARELFATMKQDGILLAAKNDALICELLRKMYCRKGGHQQHKKKEIRNAVRSISGLLLEIRKCSGMESCSMKDVIHPRNFKRIVSAVKNLAGLNPAGHYNHPEKARQLGLLIKKCAMVLKSLAIEDGNHDLMDTTQHYIDLHDMEFYTEVGADAKRTHNQNRRENPKIIPLAEDVTKLSQHLKILSESEKQKLADATTECETKMKSWGTLNKVTLTQVILLNRRREGEVSRMKVEDYTKKLNRDTRSEVEETLTPLEKNLCKILTRVEIPGKGDRNVPILLTSSMKEAIDTLMEWRTAGGVTASNPYLFASNHYSAGGHIRGSDCLRKFSSDCGAVKPSYLRSRELRRHVGVLSQILNLKENELDMLATFMGHDINVHRSHYRLPEDTLQLAKISKIFLALDSGTISQHKGKSLDEIDVVVDEGTNLANSLSDSEEAEMIQLSSNEEEICSFEETDTNFRSTPGAAEASSSTSTKRQFWADKKNKQASAKVRKIMKRTSHAKRTLDSQAKVKKTPLLHNPSRRQWSEEEKSAVERHLHSYILRGELPSANLIRACINSEPALKFRSWKNVKDYIRNSSVSLQRKRARLAKN